MLLCALEVTWCLPALKSLLPLSIGPAKTTEGIELETETRKPIFLKPIIPKTSLSYESWSPTPVFEAHDELLSSIPGSLRREALCARRFLPQIPRLSRS